MRVRSLALLIAMSLIIISVVDAKGLNANILQFPPEYRLISIYAPSEGKSIPGSYAKRYTTEYLSTLLKTPSSRLNAEKYVNGKWVAIDKREFIALLNSGKVTSAPEVPFTYGSSKQTRKAELVGTDIGRCNAVFDGATKRAIPLWDWGKLSAQKQQRIMSNPTTIQYLKRCK